MVGLGRVCSFVLPSPTNSPRSCFDSSVIIVTKEGNSLPAPSERKRAMRTTRASISPRPSVHARSPLSGFRCRRRGENAPRQRDYGTAAAPLLLRRRQPCGRARPPCNLPTNLGGRTYLHTSNVSIPFWVRCTYNCKCNHRDGLRAWGCGATYAYSPLWMPSWEIFCPPRITELTKTWPDTYGHHGTRHRIL